MNKQHACFYLNDPLAPKPNQPTHTGVACLIENEQGELLVELRQDSNYWGLIGGGLELAETLEQCVVREVFEETGLKVTEMVLFDIFSNPHRIAAYPDGNVLRVLTVAYIVKVEQGPLIISSESRELAYLPKTALKDLLIAPTHQDILTKYLGDSAIINEQKAVPKAK